MKYDLTNAHALLNQLSVAEISPESNGSRKLTIRVSDTQEAFFRGVKAAMAPGASLSDAISLGMEVVMQNTVSRTAIYHANLLSVYDVILQHNVNPHEINLLLKLLNIKELPLLDLGHKERFISSLSPDNVDLLLKLFCINKSYLVDETAMPYSIKELFLPNDIEYLKESQFTELQPIETLLIMHDPDSEVEECIVIKRIEYALNLTKSVSVYQVIGRIMLTSESGTSLKTAFINRAKDLKMRVFSLQVEQNMMLSVRNGMFFHHPGEQLNGLITYLN